MGDGSSSYVTFDLSNECTCTKLWLECNGITIHMRVAAATWYNRGIISPPDMESDIKGHPQQQLICVWYRSNKNIIDMNVDVVTYKDF